MTRSRTESARRPVLPATASSKGLGHFRLGSAQSRAAARALAATRSEIQTEDEWDKELDPSGLADSIRAARERIERGETPRQWEPLNIPPGKENTVRGRLAARINAARERIRNLEAR